VDNRATVSIYGSDLDDVVSVVRIVLSEKLVTSLSIVALLHILRLSWIL
jgi:hypothetical protein